MNYELYEPVVILKPDQVQIGSDSRIDAFVKIEGGQGVVIGRHVHVASFAHLNIGGGRLEIGDYANISSGGKIISGSNRPSGRAMSAKAPADMQVVTRSVTHLKAYSAVMTNAVVMPGVTLEEGAVLAAGGVATKNIPAWEIWGGVPARFMSKREVAA